METPNTLDKWLAHCERLHPKGQQGIELAWARAHRGQAAWACVLVPVITVAGTNGKGSTCAMLEAILGRPVTARGSTPRRTWCTSGGLLGEPVDATQLMAGFAAIEARTQNGDVVR